MCSIPAAQAYGGILLTRVGGILLREPGNHYDGCVWTYGIRLLGRLLRRIKYSLINEYYKYFNYLNSSVDDEASYFYDARMTYEEFQRQVGKAGLTMKAFAALICMNPISLSNYARQGDVPAHLAIIAALLGEMADKGLDYRAVLVRLELTAKKPRGAGRPGRFGGSRQSPLDLPEPMDQSSARQSTHG